MKPVNLTHRFTYDGRSYKIYRRPALPTGIWYLYFEKNKRRWNRSLDTTIQKDAETNAKVVIAAVKDQRWADLAKSSAKRAFADLESIIAVYENNPSGPDPKTIRNNISSFRLVVKRARGLEQLNTVSAAELTPALIRAYKNAVLESLKDNATDADQARAKRSANSTLRQARSLFARNILPIYADANLTLPDLKPFLDETGFLRVPKPAYQLPSNELVTATFKALDELRTSGDPAQLNHFKAVCLALGGGLRKSEMLHIDWQSFVTLGDRTYIRNEYICKNGRTIDLPFQTQIWQWLASVKPAGAKPTDLLIQVDCPTHFENIFRENSRWMNALGWRTQKKMHEFRAYIISKIAEQFGAIVARDWARHGTVAVTETYARHIVTKNVDVQLT